MRIDQEDILLDPFCYPWCCYFWNSHQVEIFLSSIFLCFSSRFSCSLIDKIIFESLNVFLVYFVWIVFERENFDLIRRELSRSVQTEHVFRFAECRFRWSLFRAEEENDFIEIPSSEVFILRRKTKPTKFDFSLEFWRSNENESNGFALDASRTHRLQRIITENSVSTAKFITKIFLEISQKFRTKQIRTVRKAQQKTSTEQQSNFILLLTEERIDARKILCLQKQIEQKFLENYRPIDAFRAKGRITESQSFWCVNSLKRVKQLRALNNFTTSKTFSTCDLVDIGMTEKSKLLRIINLLYITVLTLFQGSLESS